MRFRATAQRLQIALQLVGAILNFLVWLLVAWVVPAENSTVEIGAYAVGLVIALPLSLGLPSTLANSFRRDEGEDLTPYGGRSVQMIGIMAMSASVIGLVAAWIGMKALQMPAIAVALAGLTVATSGLQQSARIRRRVTPFVLGILTPVTLPVALLLLEVTGHVDERLRATVEAGSMLTVTVLVVWIQRAVITVKAKAAWSLWARRELPIAVAMVPHLLAFAALSQGVRLSTALVPGVSPEGVRTAHLIMLVVSLGLTFVTAAHGVLSVGVQLASPAEELQVLRRAAVQYLVVGIVATIAVGVALLTPVAVLFGLDGRFNLNQVAELMVIPVLFSMYYYWSGYLVRKRATAWLALMSVTAAVVWLALTFGVGGIDMNSDLNIFVGSLAILPIAAAVVVATRKLLEVRQVLRNELVLTGAVAPAVVTFFIGSLSG